MRVLLDACVLYPTVMREVLLAVAAEGHFEPLWSARILEEWSRAARKLGPVGEMQARGEVALVRARWPDAMVQPRAGIEARLYLPDPNDIHVLASAISGGADILMTLNAKDFPRGTLTEEGIMRQDPDSFLRQIAERAPDSVTGAVNKVTTEAARLSGQVRSARVLLKKARLPRLAKLFD